MITPLEIENKKFAKQTLGGYSVEEVDDFLDEITADYEKNYKENAELKARIEELEKSIEHYKTIETTLQSTLVMAQSTAEEVTNVAKQKADQIIKDAQIDARRTVEDLDQEISLKQRNLDEVKKNIDVYKAKTEALLISQIEMLKELNED